MRIVLDTNVLVSAILHESSPPGQVVELWLAGDLDLVVDSRILAEYHEVLRRVRLGLDPDRVEELLAVTQRAEYVVGYPLPFSLPDSDDLPFLEVAAAAAVDALVTGNVKHFRPRQLSRGGRGGRLGVAVLTPRQLLDRLGGR